MPMMPAHPGPPRARRRSRRAFAQPARASPAVGRATFVELSATWAYVQLPIISRIVPQLLPRTTSSAVQLRNIPCRDARRTLCIRLTDVKLMPRMIHDLHPCRSQHRFNASMIRRPPVRRIAGEVMFQERHLRPSLVREQLAIVEISAVRVDEYFLARHGQRLEDQH